MKRILAIVLSILLLLTGCSGGNSPSGETHGRSDPSAGIQGDGFSEEGPSETVSGTPEHISQWSDPLTDVPEPTYYAIDEELAWALSLIGIEPIPPEDTLDTEAPVIPTDGLWNTERSNLYDGTLTVDNLQDLFAMYASDADLTAPPPVMEPTAVPFGASEDDPGSVQINFADYYNEQSVMIAYFEDFVERNLDTYNETADYTEAVYLYLMAFFSMELAMGASFTEEMEWSQLQSGAAMAFEMFGGTDVEIIRNDAHNYTVTYLDSDGAEITDHFRADSQQGIEMLSYTDGVLTEIFQYRELGNDTYAWQSGTERLVMSFKDKTVYTCWYSKLPEEAQRYTEADSVFSTDQVLDESWVMARGDFSTEIRFDGTTLSVRTAGSWFGGEGSAVITSPA